ncbi:hypothetical protein HZF02_15895 [Pseudomonas yamanorum]|nr:hypothetical protein HZF02_15895 [Pseudomonas yamanorum]
MRDELKRATDELFSKDLKIIELKEYVHRLDNVLVKLARLQLAGKYGDIHIEIQRLAAHYQLQQAAQAAKQVH